jgi:hypothetical protein
MEAVMHRPVIATGAMVFVLLLCGCYGNAPNDAYSQQRAISADIDASFHHQPFGNSPAFDIR